MNRTLFTKHKLYQQFHVHQVYILGRSRGHRLNWLNFFEISDETKAEIDDEEEAVSFSERYYNNQQTTRSEREPGFIGHSQSQGLDHSHQYGNTGYGVSSPGIQN